MADSLPKTLAFERIRFEAPKMNHQVCFNVRAITLRGCSGNYGMVFGKDNMIQVQIKKIYFFNDRKWTDENWELLCSFVASNTFIQELDVTVWYATRNARQRTTRTKQLLEAMEQNSSLRYVK
jgi:hypothetical protein